MDSVTAAMESWKFWEKKKNMTVVKLFGLDQKAYYEKQNSLHKVLFMPWRKVFRSLHVEINNSNFAEIYPNTAAVIMHQWRNYVS